jgi:hypothetical protein
MGLTRKMAQGRSLGTLTTAFVLTVLAALLLAGAALAAAKPGKPVAKSPKGAITTTRPTLTWSKAPRAARYEVRVYDGGKLLVKKTGLAKLSWKSSRTLPRDVALTWKVRARNAGGNGVWSKRPTFKVVTLAIGDAYGGGKVAYILQGGDPGYNAYAQHGLIAATVDQSIGIRWSNGANVVTGAMGTALGTGSANTAKIIAAQGEPATSYAAGLARAYRGGGHADWYLPSKDEQDLLYLHRGAIGGFVAAYYWSSTEHDASDVYYQNFSGGGWDWNVKSDVNGVRAVRSF